MQLRGTSHRRPAGPVVASIDRVATRGSCGLEDIQSLRRGHRRHAALVTSVRPPPRAPRPLPPRSGPACGASALPTPDRAGGVEGSGRTKPRPRVGHEAERGQQRHGEARGDEQLGHRTIRSLVGDLGLESAMLSAQSEEQPRVRRVRRRTGPAVLGQIRQIHLPLARKPVSLRECDGVGSSRRCVQESRSSASSA